MRRGSLAAYLGINHPDIEEFIDVRRPLGDPNRKCLEIYNAVCIPNAFMQKVEEGDQASVDLWLKLLQTRIETGAPYIQFDDNINNNLPEAYVNHNLKVKHSNLCVAPETKILTDNGYKMIVGLEDQLVNVWNGEEFSEVQVKKTGENQKLLTVKLDNGVSVDCTPYHKYYIQSRRHTRDTQVHEISARDLKPGDRIIRFHLPTIEGHTELEKAYTNGFFTGDGCFFNGRNIIYLYSDKKDLLSFIESDDQPICESPNRIIIHDVKGLKPKFFVPDASYTVSSRLQWLAGLLDADGCVTRNGDIQSLQLASVNRDFLNRLFLMLQELGIQSCVKFTRKAGEFLLPANDGSGETKLYSCKEVNRILINQENLYKLVSLGLKTNRLKINVKKPLHANKTKFVRVVSVVDAGRISDTYCVNEPKQHKVVFNGVLTGNCSEIMLPSSSTETYVCVLSSLNLAKWDEWKDSDAIRLSVRFLDGVCEEFLHKARGQKGLEKAVRFVELHRALGLGVLGFHSLLQSKNLAFDSLQAKLLNQQIFRTIRSEAEKESSDLAFNYGSPYYCRGLRRRNTTLLAVAPTTSNALISSNVSQSIEPWAANIFSQQSAKGTFIRKNPILEKLLKSLDQDTPDVWSSINEAKGSVAHLEFLTDEQKNVFKTAREINQHVIVTLAADRQVFIDQGQALNLFFNSNASEDYIHEVHLEAWKKGLKTLYYLRSEGVLSGDSMDYRSVDDCVYCES